MSSTEGKWEVVNTKQKKKTKEKERNEKRQLEKLERKKIEQQEEQRKREEKERFFAQYVSAKKTDLAENAFSILEGAEERFQAQEAKRKEREQKQQQLYSEGAVEILHFAPDTRKKQKDKKDGSSKPTKQPKVKKPTLQQAASQLDNGYLKQFLSQCSQFTNEKQKYPSNYEVQLKSLAEHFETIFNATEDIPDVAVSDTEIPIIYVKKEVVDSVKTWMDKMPEEALVLFFWFLICTLIDIHLEKRANRTPVTKGFGVMLLIQLMSRFYPNAIIKNYTKMKEQYCTQNNLLQPQLISTFLWIFYQPIEHHVSVTVSGWFNFLFPLIVDDKTSEDVKKASVALMKKAINTKKKEFCDDVTAVQALEKVLLLLVTPDAKLPPSLKPLLPTLSDPAFYFPSGNVSKRLFNMMLSHTATDKEAFRNKLLGHLLDFVVRDERCFGYWMESYHKLIAQSNNLLLFIHLNWDKHKLSQKMNGKKVVEAARYFAKVNKEILKGTFVDPKTKKTRKVSSSEMKEIEMCNVTCKSVKQKLSRFDDKKNGGGRLGTLMLTLLPTAALLVGAAYYTANHCCEMDWCNSIHLFHDVLQCK